MAGHSKWKNIRHKKAKEDAKKGKAFTRLTKEITVLVRGLGGGDVESNPRLRLLLEKAREANMPKENVERAIKKGQGLLEGANYESVLYEGYGPDGVALLIEALTDNRNRTASDLRHFFNKHGGRMAEGGSVSWMFDQKGLIELAKTVDDEDTILEKFLDKNADIDNIKVDEQQVMIQTPIPALDAVRQIAEQLGYTVKSAGLGWVAKNQIEVAAENEEQVYDFLDALDEIEDVQEIYANID